MSSEEKINELLNKMGEYARKGNLKKALNLSDELVKIDSKYCNKKADCLYSLGMYNEAAENYCLFLRNYAKTNDLINNYAELLWNTIFHIAEKEFKNKEFKKAIYTCDNFINSIVDKHSLLFKILHIKSSSLYKIKQYNEAIPLFDKIIYDISNDTDRIVAKSYYKKSLCLIALNKYKEALDCCNEAINNSFRLSGIFYTKGLALQKQKSYNEAIISYDMAIEINANYKDAYKEK